MTSSSLSLQFLKFFSTIFFATFQSITVPNFMSKELSYQDLRRGRGCYVPRSPLGMIRQKYPGGYRVKKKLKQGTEVEK